VSRAIEKKKEAGLKMYTYKLTGTKALLTKFMELKLYDL